jgi:Rps23 Pro-64 3,4-dihydroxylase Tpa1-like proline 4-hydroxylase
MIEITKKMDYINPIHLEENKLEEYSLSFQNALPYKHIVIDNFLKEDFAESLFQNFPTLEKLNKHYKGLNENKSEGSNFKDFHESFTLLKGDIMSEELAKWTSKITGIDDLFVTDDKLGTGLHQGSNGSFLDIHIDFNIHAEKNVHRRLNLLIYMNKNWLQEYGGDLEMWDSKMTRCEKKVAPLFNRCVIFETNEISYHGYSKINLPEGVTRKSIYAYFYTQIREGAMGYHDTVFKAKPEDTTLKKIGTNVKETLKNFTKAQLKKIGINI